MNKIDTTAPTRVKIIGCSSSLPSTAVEIVLFDPSIVSLSPFNGLIEAFVGLGVSGEGVGAGVGAFVGLGVFGADVGAFVGLGVSGTGVGAFVGLGTGVGAVVGLGDSGTGIGAVVGLGDSGTGVGAVVGELFASVLFDDGTGVGACVVLLTADGCFGCTLSGDFNTIESELRIRIYPYSTYSNRLEQIQLVFYQHRKSHHDSTSNSLL